MQRIYRQFSFYWDVSEIVFSLYNNIFHTLKFYAEPEAMHAVHPPSEVKETGVLWKKVT